MTEETKKEVSVADIGTREEAGAAEVSPTETAPSVESKKLAALQKVLSAHNIKVDLEGADLDNFNYQLPSVPTVIVQAPPQGDGGTAGTMTLDDIKQMSTDEVNQNWETVQKVLKAQKKQ